MLVRWQSQRCCLVQADCTFGQSRPIVETVIKPLRDDHAKAVQHPFTCAHLEAIKLRQVSSNDPSCMSILKKVK